MSDDQTPGLDQVIAAWGEDRAKRTYTMLPAKVVRWDPDRQVVDAAPVVPELHEGEDGERVVENLPPITEVPVVFLGAPGFRITFPVPVGSYVTLLFASASLDTWQGTGTDNTDPGDERRNHLSDAVAIPGLHTPGSPPTTVPNALTLHGAELRLGGPNASDSAARKSDLDTLKTLLTSAAFQAAVAAAFGDSGSSLNSLIVSSLTGWPVASTTKIQ